MTNNESQSNVTDNPGHDDRTGRPRFQIRMSTLLLLVTLFGFCLACESGRRIGQELETKVNSLRAIEEKFEQIESTLESREGMRQEKIYLPLDNIKPVKLSALDRFG